MPSVEDDFLDPTGWPVGDVNVPYEDLREHLLHAAALHARRAVLQRGSSRLLDLLDAAGSVGAAIELASKAAIAAVEPALLAAPARAEAGPPTRAIMHLRGHRSRVTDSAVNEVATIMVRPAIQLAGELHRRITIPAKQLDPAIQVRNAAVHMGLVQDDLLLEAVQLMARYLEQVVSALEEDRTHFWTEHVAALVTALLDERRDAVATLARDLIAQAAATYDRRWGQLEGALKESLISLAEAQRPAWGADAVDHPCPVCGRRGWLVVDLDVDVESIGGGQYEASGEYAFIAQFECAVCGLELEPEMFAAAGIDEMDVWTGWGTGD